MRLFIMRADRAAVAPRREMRSKYRTFRKSAAKQINKSVAKYLSKI